MTQEALKLALEALEAPSPMGQYKAITAIKEALAQPEQEPVAWGVDWGKAGDIACVSIIKRLPNDVIEVVAVEYAPYSYTTPPQRTEQEPVKIAHRHEWFRTGEMKVGQMRCISCGTWGHEEMPQRTWVDLTSEDWNEIFDNALNKVEAIKLTKAKLKEKNT